MVGVGNTYINFKQVQQILTYLAQKLSSSCSFDWISLNVYFSPRVDI